MLSMFQFGAPSGKAAVSPCEICWNQTELTEILFIRRYKVNIHMLIVGVGCKFQSDI